MNVSNTNLNNLNLIKFNFRFFRLPEREILEAEKNYFIQRIFSLENF